MREGLALMATVLLSACSGAAADPCGVLCADAGYNQVDELGDAESQSCVCSGGLGGVIDQQTCDAYCAQVDFEVAEAVVEKTELDGDTCTCVRQ